jgi:2-succinyl-6-hydroxy-2,4-cyclohexadiene-1-carboxylate synthase
MHLHRTTSGHGRRTVLVHGFTQTGASWAPVLERGAVPGEAVCVDLPGHGWSGDVAADLWGTGDLLADVAQGAPASWVGYSLGGRCSLHLALAHPDLVRSLVLVSATAGMDDEDERAARRTADEALAEHIEQIGVPTFLDEWLAQPLFAGLTPASDGRQARLANTAEGLASSLRLAGTGTQEPLWGRLVEIEAPVLLIAGARDERFVAHAERMAALLPQAEAEIIPDAGHTAHLEQPEAFAAVLSDWLRR